MMMNSKPDFRNIEFVDLTSESDPEVEDERETIAREAADHGMTPRETHSV
jgi:hypothetical protein